MQGLFLGWRALNAAVWVGTVWVAAAWVSAQFGLVQFGGAAL